MRFDHGHVCGAGGERFFLVGRVLEDGGGPASARRGRLWDEFRHDLRLARSSLSSVRLETHPAARPQKVKQPTHMT